MLSLIYPAQAHINNRDLKKIIQDIGPVKSILKYNSLHNVPLNIKNETDNRINRVLNNWHDIEFFRWLVIDPKKASSFIESPYYESLGHSYSMAWSSVLWLLSSTIDNNMDFLPDIKRWEEEFNYLKKNKVKGYYCGSDMLLSPLGAREIFEGQARFSQLQYLYFSSGRKMNWDDFERAGMLGGLYKGAFDTFLKILGLPWPSTPEDSSWIHKRRILEVSEILCNYISCKTPYSAAEKICDWANTSCKDLLEEDNSFEFAPENLPVRLLFARFLKYQQDKFVAPEFFCWPGVWSVGESKSGITLDKARELFDKHRALFCDGVDGDIYPSTFPDKDEQSVLKTFNAFYSWNLTYELTRQWIVQEGDFEYNFSWLTSKYSKSEVSSWVRDQFRNVYGVDPMAFKIL